MVFASRQMSFENVPDASLSLQLTLISFFSLSSFAAQSEKFRQGVFGSAWLDAKDRRRVKPLVILTMMQQPMTIKAMKMFNMSVQMFVNVSVDEYAAESLAQVCIFYKRIFHSQVINTTISYYVLLRSVGERK